MLHKQLLLHIILLLTVACSPTLQEDNNTPHNGDLIFVRAKDDNGLSGAIAAATGIYDHVGIICVDGETVTVIDASPRNGVAERTWEAFVDENPQYVVMALDDADCIDLHAVVCRAREYLDRPYDWEYGLGDSAIYCSELVQLCYLDSVGQPIFPSRPMNFRSADGSMSQYWVTHFDSLGIDVPQDMPGTNPTDISKHNNLKIR